MTQLLELPSCVWIIFEDLDHFLVKFLEKSSQQEAMIKSLEWEFASPKWNPENKTWRFEADCFRDVVELVKEYY